MLNKWRGRTDGGAKRPVTCRARLLAAWCARCTWCGVLWHGDICIHRLIACLHNHNNLATYTAWLPHFGPGEHFSHGNEYFGPDFKNRTGQHWCGKGPRTGYTPSVRTKSWTAMPCEHGVGLKIEIHEIHQNLRNPVSFIGL